MWGFQCEKKIPFELSPEMRGRDQQAKMFSKNSGFRNRLLQRPLWPVCMNTGDIPERSGHRSRQTVEVFAHRAEKSGFATLPSPICASRQPVFMLGECRDYVVGLSPMLHAEPGTEQPVNKCLLNQMIDEQPVLFNLALPHAIRIQAFSLKTAVAHVFHSLGASSL